MFWVTEIKRVKEPQLPARYPNMVNVLGYPAKMSKRATTLGHISYIVPDVLCG
jgi:hypothetical protein